MAPPREVVPKAGSVLVPGGAAVPKENEAGGGGNVVFPNPPPEPPKLNVDKFKRLNNLCRVTFGLEILV